MALRPEGLQVAAGEVSAMKKIAVVVVVFALASVGVRAQNLAVPNFAVPLVQGPDIPALNDPTQVVVFDFEHFDACAGKVEARKTVTIPSGDWNRAVLRFTGIPDGDPWDRLFGISINGVEVLRGTSPRTSFELRKDITEFLSLVPSGGQATFKLNFGTYVGAQVGWLVLELYKNEPTGLVSAAPWDAVVPAFDMAGLNGSGRTITTQVEFADAPPSAATVELTLSNHGSEEAMFANRVFHVLVDGQEIAVARPMPYTYAIAGTGAGNANNACSGRATDWTGDIVHPLTWWTAQRAADAAGIHAGVGEIPPYRAQVTADGVKLLTHARQIEVQQQGGGAVWITSLSFLLKK